MQPAELPDNHEFTLDVIRHSTAHLLAHAVKRLFPEVQIAIGPVIENGFYYDFACSRPFTPDDLVTIEVMMLRIVKENILISRRELSYTAAKAYFLKQNEQYKLEIIDALATNAIISLYKQGDFEDLCRGPHVNSTGQLTIFKLTSIAGAYWRGNSDNDMLQRIYGTAWHTQSELDAYLLRIAEAEKRDHRKLGKTLDLFHFNELSPGMVFWHTKGWTIYQIIEKYMRQRLDAYGYQEVKTPQIVDRILWEKSGHWDNFREYMFTTETENRLYAIKPMNCPCHVQIYNQKLRSYRDLPLRLSEFGNCHRCEPSGSLHGLMRVRNMVIDDAHIFCTETQIQSEVTTMLSLIKLVYQDFGFTDITYKLALRPEKRVGDETLWDKAENALRQAMQEHKIMWIDVENEGAFYGPKIECSLADSLGRVWQCGTIQVDFSMPERLGAYYITEDNTKNTAVMLHRAILGTFERFIGILIEHCAGEFPLWLAPIQVMVLPISVKHHEFAKKIHDVLQKNQIRVNFDLRNEKIGFKIREHTLQKIPYLLIVGDKELTMNNITVRTCKGVDLGAMDIDQFNQLLDQSIQSKSVINDN